MKQRGERSSRRRRSQHRVFSLLSFSLLLSPIPIPSAYLVNGRVDLDVNVVAQAVGAQVHRKRDGTVAAERARERVARAGAETVAGRHGCLFSLFFSFEGGEERASQALLLMIGANRRNEREREEQRKVSQKGRKEKKFNRRPSSAAAAAERERRLPFFPRFIASRLDSRSGSSPRATLADSSRLALQRKFQGEHSTAWEEGGQQKRAAAAAFCSDQAKQKALSPAHLLPQPARRCDSWQHQA